MVVSITSKKEKNLEIEKRPIKTRIDIAEWIEKKQLPVG